MSDLQKLAEWSAGEAEKCLQHSDEFPGWFKHHAENHLKVAKILRLLDRVRSECEIDYPMRFDHDRPGDPTAMEVSGTEGLLRQLAERLKQD